jgi:hypothetical protein
VYRYKVDLVVARATKSPGLLSEDRVTILEGGREIAFAGMNRFALNKSLLAAYAELGLEYYRITGGLEVFDDAMSRLSEAEERLGDPDVTRTISRLMQRLRGQPADAERNGYPA